MASGILNRPSRIPGYASSLRLACSGGLLSSRWASVYGVSRAFGSLPVSSPVARRPSLRGVSSVSLPSASCYGVCLYASLPGQRVACRSAVRTGSQPGSVHRWQVAGSGRAQAASRGHIRRMTDDGCCSVAVAGRSADGLDPAAPSVWPRRGGVRAGQGAH